MDKIIEELVKLSPLTPYIELLLVQYGYTKETSNVVSFVINALLLYGLIHLYKYLVNRYKNAQAAKRLPNFDYQKVTSSRELFIPTRGQNHSPAREEEPSQSRRFISSQSLIPFFINNAFNEKKETNKYYLILADSGMGKTTFMINLYLQYTSFFNFKGGQKIKLLSFGDTRILDQIREIKQAEALETILLLDAFDEYKGLLPPETPDGLTDDGRFRMRLDEITELTRDFREVVITSRTQYFPGQEAEAYELKIHRFDDKGFHTLGKLYISPFSDKEVKQYLNKKYGIFRFWNWKKKKKATAIVQKSPKLMVRPMLLSYIDLLVDDSNRAFKKTFDIYETLIEKWIDREAQKRKYEHSTREKFKKDLLEYSRRIALEIFNHRTNTGFLYVPKAEAIAIAQKNNLDLTDYEITGQSLLTRDAEGNWKFAHKSILEFFIAQDLIQHPESWENIEFSGMDMAQQFYEEHFPFGIILVKVAGGAFKMGSNEYESEQPIHDVTVRDIYIGKYPITQKQWQAVMGNNPSKFKGENLPVEYVSWDDAQSFLKKLSDKTGQKYRLPTEAEWEFAARGGKKSKKGYSYSGSNDVNEVAWYRENSESKTHPVGSKLPNELGIYDMSGNVWEWCEDVWHENYKGAPNNSMAWTKGVDKNTIRVVRGGCWGSSDNYCRVSSRSGSDAFNHFNDVGFRCVRYD